jgi:hypothetical protein
MAARDALRARVERDVDFKGSSLQPAGGSYVNVAVVKVRKLVSNNKAIAAALSSFGTIASGALATWIASGQFDAAELRISAGALVASLITGGVTWAVSAGDAVIEGGQLDQLTAGDPVPKQVVIEPV